MQVNSVPIIDTSTGAVVNEGYPKTAPDHIAVMGTLLQNDAPVSITVRMSKSKSCADKNGFRWYITGTEGEILVSTEEGGWQGGDHSQRSIKVVTGKDKEAELIDYTSGDDSLAAKVPLPGTNTARQYASFAKKDAEVVTFESALKTHQLLRRIAEAAGWQY